jgi:hypothetical protein
MKIGNDSQLAVKWSNGTWTYYRVAPYRKFESLVAYFTNLPNFRFAILYKYDKKQQVREYQIGYFDKHRRNFCG